MLYLTAYARARVNEIPRSEIRNERNWKRKINKSVRGKPILFQCMRKIVAKATEVENIYVIHGWGNKSGFDFPWVIGKTFKGKRGYFFPKRSENIKGGMKFF